VNRSVELHLSGELDLAGSGSLGELMAGLVLASSADVVLDLAELGFMDCTGLRAIALTNRDLAGADRRLLAIRNVSSGVRRTFELTGMLEQLGTA
jgi:anti-sigma B factor antagonist